MIRTDGKNTLLVNDRFGNMIWLGAIVTNASLMPDALADYQTGKVDCRICLDACPAQALDGKAIVQKKCRSISGKYSDGGGVVYACNLCRKLCPSCRGGDIKGQCFNFGRFWYAMAPRMER